MFFLKLTDVTTGEQIVVNIGSVLLMEKDGDGTALFPAGLPSRLYDCMEGRGPVRVKEDITAIKRRIGAR